MSLYELENITRRYKQRTVLDLEKLEIPGKGITVLLGPNGSGKTTLLDILAFLKPPDSGRMGFMGREVYFSENVLQNLRRMVVLVPQHPLLFTTSVYKNVEYGLKVRGKGKAERERAAAEALEMVGMSDFISQRSHKLSGGETQRVAIARALACKPRVILFDEPTASVDLEHQDVIEHIIRDIAGSGRANVVFSTHDFDLARRLADHRIFLLAGRPADPKHDNIYTVVIKDGESGLADCMSGDLLVARARTGARGKASISVDMNAMVLADGGHKQGPGVVHAGRITRMAYERRGVRILVQADLNFRIMTDRGRLEELGLAIGDVTRVIIPPEAVEVI